MSRIFLLRHVQSIANEKGILSGRKPDISLSKRGILEREALRNRLEKADFDYVYSSPLERCIKTIEGMNQNIDLVEEFNEVDYGDWSGKSNKTLSRKLEWQKLMKEPTSVRFPNGETLLEVQIRALKGIEIIDTSKKNVLVVTHSDVIKVIILHALESHVNNINKINLENGSITILDKFSTGLSLIKTNDTSSRISELFL